MNLFANFFRRPEGGGRHKNFLEWHWVVIITHHVHFTLDFEDSDPRKESRVWFSVCEKGFTRMKWKEEETNECKIWKWNFWHLLKKASVDNFIMSAIFLSYFLEPGTTYILFDSFMIVSREPLNNTRQRKYSGTGKTCRGKVKRKAQRLSAQL